MRANIVIILYLYSFTLTHGVKCGPTWLRNRVKVVHPSGSIAAFMNENNQQKLALGRLLEHFEQLEKRLDYEGELNGTKCARSGRYSLKSVRAIVHNLGWGRFEGCHTKLDGDGDADTSHRLFETLGVLRRAAARAGEKFIPSLPDGIWNHSVENGFFEYSDKSVYSRCGVARSLGYRIEGKWRIAIDITNAAPSRKLPEWQRGYYQETLYIDDNGVVRGYPMNVPKCQGNESIPGEVGDAVVSLWGGSPKWSTFLTDDIEDNPALKKVLHSLNDNDYVKGQVEESYRLSSIAILILPSVFVLLPINFFQFVDDTCTVLYIIVTDVVSVIPIAIKGIELLTFYRRKHYTTISYVYGNTKSPVMAAETWVSSCQLSESVRSHGIGLLTFAICAFALGVLFETLAHIRVMKDKEIWDNALRRYFMDSSNGNMNEAEKFLYSHFAEHGGGGMFWYFAQVRIMKRIRNRGLNSRREKLMRLFCDWVFAEHQHAFVPKKVSEQHNFGVPPIAKSKCFILRKIRPIIAKRK